MEWSGYEDWGMGNLDSCAAWASADEQCWWPEVNLFEMRGRPARGSPSQLGSPESTRLHVACYPRSLLSTQLAIHVARCHVAHFPRSSLSARPHR